MLAARRPALVLLVQPPVDVDRTGATGRILARRYRVVATIDGTKILRPDS